MNALDFVDDRVVLLRLRSVDEVRLGNTLDFPVRRNGEHVELIDLPEFARFGHRRTGHAADLVVELKEVLERNGRERLVLFFDLDVLFRFDRLMQTVAPSTPFHKTPGKVVDDNDFAVFNNVVDVFLIEVARLQRVVDEVRPVHIADRIEALDAREVFRAADPLVGKVRRVVFFVDFKVDVFFKLNGDLIGGAVFRHVVVGRARDNERGTRFVD